MSTLAAIKLNHSTPWTFLVFSKKVIFLLRGTSRYLPHPTKNLPPKGGLKDGQPLIDEDAF